LIISVEVGVLRRADYAVRDRFAWNWARRPEVWFMPSIAEVQVQGKVVWRGHSGSLKLLRKTIAQS
jgi:uncharacterized Fe-S cluster protein YjdI